MDKLSRRLSFKLPIVIRYSISFPLGFGIIHGAIKQNFKYFRMHLMASPLYMAILCQ
jgi:hypothetical protein